MENFKIKKVEGWGWLRDLESMDFIKVGKTQRRARIRVPERDTKSAARSQFFSHLQSLFQFPSHFNRWLMRGLTKHSLWSIAACFSKHSLTSPPINPALSNTPVIADPPPPQTMEMRIGRWRCREDTGVKEGLQAQRSLLYYPISCSESPCCRAEIC